VKFDVELNGKGYMLASLSKAWDKNLASKDVVTEGEKEIFRQRNYQLGTNQEVMDNTEIGEQRFADSQSFDVSEKGILFPSPRMNVTDIPGADGVSTYLPLGIMNGQIWVGYGSSVHGFSLGSGWTSEYEHTSGETIRDLLFNTDLPSSIYVSMSTWVRRFDGAAWSDYSTPDAIEKMCDHDNQLYGISNAVGGGFFKLSDSGYTQYDAEKFTQWTLTDLCAHGNDIFIIGNQPSYGARVWRFDGTNVTVFDNFSLPVELFSLESHNGVLYMGGGMYTGSAGAAYIGALWYYIEGQGGFLTITDNKNPAPGVWSGAFQQITAMKGSGRFLYFGWSGYGIGRYDTALGGISRYVGFPSVVQGARDTIRDIEFLWGRLFFTSGTQYKLFYTDRNIADGKIVITDDDFDDAWLETSLIDFGKDVAKWFSKFYIACKKHTNHTITIKYRHKIGDSWTTLGTIPPSYSSTGASFSIQKSARQIQFRIELNVIGGDSDALTEIYGWSCTIAGLDTSEIGVSTWELTLALETGVDDRVLAPEAKTAYDKRKEIEDLITNQVTSGPWNFKDIDFDDTGITHKVLVRSYEFFTEEQSQDVPQGSYVKLVLEELP
jgi:hypothetical protein